MENVMTIKNKVGCAMVLVPAVALLVFAIAQDPLVGIVVLGVVVYGSIAGILIVAD